ncbi:MAG TPA: cupin domain-containing protein [Jatrophihabitans sp.]|nr:cupin domain-containing protein [Jatrophihabitans sp.]
MPVLARCVGVSPAEFAERYWSRQPLFSPAAATGQRFDDLLSLPAIDELLSRRGLRTPFIRMVNQGKVIPASAYTRSGGAGAGITDQVADDRVLSLIADGASLVLQALHRTWPPLIDFGTELAGELGHPVQINAYLTPPQNQGFAAHYDTHDVFVLQVAGAKRWRVHAPVLDDPLPEQAWQQHRDAVAARAAEPALLELELQPGDALYLPRGYLHSATALGQNCLHLTVGVHPVTRYTLLRQLLAEAANSPALRRSLPIAADLSDPATLGPQLADTIAEWVDFLGGSRLTAVSDGLAAELAASTRPAPIEPLGQLALLAELGPDTRLRLRPGLRPRLVAGDGELILHAVDQQLRLAPELAPALKQLLSGEPVSASTLAGPALADRLDLVRRLLVAGVLAPAGAHA